MISELRPLALKVVDGLDLAEPYREVLQPGAFLYDGKGRARRLPRFFYEVGSWKTAKNTELAPGFGLYEFLHTDVREAKLLQGFPRYVPCAITLLAAHLSLLRQRVGTYVHIAANGGYRSPGHAIARNASPHHWGTAVNLYRIGDDYLDTKEQIEAYAAIVRELMPAVTIRPYGHHIGFSDDHLHLDLGYAAVVPHEAASEVEETDQAAAA